LAIFFLGTTQRRDPELVFAIVQAPEAGSNVAPDFHVITRKTGLHDLRQIKRIVCARPLKITLFP
jgi:hypothetical protein